MKVRAKFYVVAINPCKFVYPDQSEVEGAGVTLKAVHAKTVNDKGEFVSYEQSNEENKLFGRYTPSGDIYMSIANPAAVAQFQVGKEYYVEFSAAPDTPNACHRTDHN